MSERVDGSASNEANNNSSERERTRSPRGPPPSPEDLFLDMAAVQEARSTCPICLRVFDSAKAMWGHSWVHREGRDQIYAMGPPAPPPPPPPMGVPVGGGGGGAVGGGPPGWHAWRIDSLELYDRSCPRCTRVFHSPKAMYGHLHVHHERAVDMAPVPMPNWGSAVAGPTHDGQPEDYGDDVSDRSIVLLSSDTDDEDEDEDEDGEYPLSIDLNRPAPEEGEEQDGDEQTSPWFDLNLTPPSG